MIHIERQKNWLRQTIFDYNTTIHLCDMSLDSNPLVVSLDNVIKSTRGFKWTFTIASRDSQIVIGVVNTFMIPSANAISPLINLHR